MQTIWVWQYSWSIWEILSKSENNKSQTINVMIDQTMKNEMKKQINKTKKTNMILRILILINASNFSVHAIQFEQPFEQTSNDKKYQPTQK